MHNAHPETTEPRQTKETEGALPRFRIAAARRGFVVIDRLGRIGGIFINETAARHFVHEEIGGPVDAIEVDRTVAVLDPFLLSAA